MPLPTLRLGPEIAPDLVGEGPPEKHLWCSILLQALSDADPPATCGRRLRDAEWLQLQAARAWLRRPTADLALMLDFSGISRDVWPAILRRLEARWRTLGDAHQAGRQRRLKDQGKAA